MILDGSMLSVFDVILINLLEPQRVDGIVFLSHEADYDWLSNKD